MKKLTLSLTLVALALVPALQAGEGKETAKNKSACCAEAKSDCASACATACTAKKATVTKKVDHSLKGATLLVLK
jgi:uncharacterized lipoprotein NlpE involved in copper resistance